MLLFNFKIMHREPKKFVKFSSLLLSIKAFRKFRGVLYDFETTTNLIGKIMTGFEKMINNKMKFIY